MKSGADGAHFFGALLLTFSFDKHKFELFIAKQHRAIQNATILAFELHDATIL